MPTYSWSNYSCNPLSAHRLEACATASLVPEGREEKLSRSRLRLDRERRVRAWPSDRSPYLPLGEIKIYPDIKTIYKGRALPTIKEFRDIAEGISLKAKRTLSRLMKESPLYPSG